MSYVKEWTEIYLKEALQRLKPQLHGYELTIEDVYTLQQMCAYEVRGRSGLLGDGLLFRSRRQLAGPLLLLLLLLLPLLMH